METHSIDELLKQITDLKAEIAELKKQLAIEIRTANAQVEINKEYKAEIVELKAGIDRLKVEILHK